MSSSVTSNIGLLFVVMLSRAPRWAPEAGNFRSVFVSFSCSARSARSLEYKQIQQFYEASSRDLKIDTCLSQIQAFVRHHESTKQPIALVTVRCGFPRTFARTIERILVLNFHFPFFSREEQRFHWKETQFALLTISGTRIPYRNSNESSQTILGRCFGKFPARESAARPSPNT